jgi:hypothetical protein
MATESPRLFFIGGPPRTGTTFFANWIQETWPDPKLWFRESGVTKMIHEMVCALDFNRRGHKWGFDALNSANQEERVRLIARIRELAFDLYRSIAGESNDTGVPWILDKDPIIFPDGADIYRHIHEVFPETRFLILIRGYRYILNSMKRRDYTRPPYPRPNVLSPYAFGARWIENVNCDVEMPERGEGYGFLHEPAPWSFQKCCVNLRNSIDAVHDSLPDLGDQVRIVRYEDLGDSDAVRAMIGDFTGVPLEQEIPFSPKVSSVELSESEEQEIERELAAPGTLEKQARLEKIAAETLAPWR